jgi:hypothetical protein
VERVSDESVNSDNSGEGEICRITEVEDISHQLEDEEDQEELKLMDTSSM